MPTPFIEFVLLYPNDPSTFPSADTSTSLMSVLNGLADNPRVLTLQFRRTPSSPSPSISGPQIALLLAWPSLADHDHYDVVGTTPDLLKTMFAHLTHRKDCICYLYLSAEDIEMAALDREGPLVAGIYRVPGERRKEVAEWLVKSVPEGIVWAWHSQGKDVDEAMGRKGWDEEVEQRLVTFEDSNGERDDLRKFVEQIGGSVEVLVLEKWLYV